MIHHVSRGISWCGEIIGILVLDESIPRVPGSVLNAETFSFPVRYKKIKGAAVKRLLKDKDPTLIQPFIDGARELESEGVASIAGSCGFMALFQREIAQAVKIPVAMSSLLQIPLILAFLGGRRIGVITANAASLTNQVFMGAGVTLEQIEEKIVIVGLDNAPEAQGAMLEEKLSLDEEVFRLEVIDAARQLMKEAPDIGAIVLECSELPPYARDIQELTGLPVFDFVTLIQYLHTGLRTRSWK